MSLSGGFGSGRQDAHRHRRTGPVLTLLHGERIPRPGYGHTQRSRAVELRVPAHVDALAIVRAMTDTLAGYEGLDADTAAELALAVDEACTVLIDMAVAGAALTLTEEPRVHEVIVRVSTICDTAVDDPVPPALGGFSRRVLDALVDGVETLVEDIDDSDNRCAGRVFGIALTVRR